MRGRINRLTPKPEGASLALTQGTNHTIKLPIMSTDLNLLLESEYNNSGELMGLDSDGFAQLANLDPVRRAMILKKLTKTNPSRGSRAEFEKFFPQLPRHIKEQLFKGGLRLADGVIYSMKTITSKTIKMFEPQDEKAVGIRNVANAKLPKNMVFVVSGIILLAGVCADVNNLEKFKATNMEGISKIPALVNGEFSLKANRKYFIPEGTSNRLFHTENNNLINLGYIKLSNPRPIMDEELLEFTIELGTMDGIDPNTVIYVGLVGTGTTP